LKEKKKKGTILKLVFSAESTTELLQKKRSKRALLSTFGKFETASLVSVPPPVMVDENSPSTVIGNRDRELLIPVADSVTDASKPSSSSSSVHHAGREVISSFILLL
jgi:hypothetical protein